VSLRNTVRAYPVLLKVGFSEAVAYRAEFFVWVLTTTMPLIMLALWSAVAAEAPMGRYGQAQFTAYFLSTFIVRQLTSSWSAWQMNYEVRHGIMSMRLLKPIHPLWAYAAENWAALPLRLVVAVPLAAVALALVGTGQLPSDPLTWLAWTASMAGAWLITFLVNVAVGSLSFHMESSVKVMDVWYAVFFVLSGYLIPIELFPEPLRVLADWLPFRYQLGLPVEILTHAYDASGAWWMVARQWGFVAVTWALAAVIWRTGVRRFEAYGG
jgi:ABC-2 type transport system permease protein